MRFIRKYSPHRNISPSGNRYGLFFRPGNTKYHIDFFMTNAKSEFRRFAVHHHGIGSQHVDQFISGVERRFMPMAMTPYITEERQLNVAQMDVFSRLMMDRIIFLGDSVDDKIANIIQAQ